MTETVVDLHALQQSPENRDARGRFASGNLAAARHGLRIRPDHPDLASALVERHDAIICDLGGPSALSTAEGITVRELARVSLLVESAGEALLREGLLTSKGRARAMVSVYQGLLDRQTKLVSMVGLARRSRLSGVAGIVASVKATDGQ